MSDIFLRLLIRPQPEPDSLMIVYLFSLHAIGVGDGLTSRILTCTELKGHCFVLVSGYVC